MTVGHPSGAGRPDDYLERLQATWDVLGRTDPMWAILSEPDTKGNRWDPAEFMRSGITEVAGLMDYLGSLGVPLGKPAALDFGCGMGRLSQALADHFDHVIGVDIAPSMLERARLLNRHGPRCEFVLNDSDNLEFAAGDSFDLVYSSRVLQHIAPAHARLYLAEFLRVLRVGGIMVVQLPSHLAPSLKKAKEDVKRMTPDAVLRAYRFMRWRGRGPNLPFEMHAIHRDDVVAWVVEHGGTVLDITENKDAGPDWVSFRYCCVKGAAENPRREVR